MKKLIRYVLQYNIAALLVGLELLDSTPRRSKAVRPSRKRESRGEKEVAARAG
jgi:hypothetical protein